VSLVAVLGLAAAIGLDALPGLGPPDSDVAAATATSTALPAAEPTATQLPSPTDPPTAAPTPAPTPTASPGPTGPSAIGLQPGSVNRASINLRVTYDVRLRLGYDSRGFRVDSTMTIENTSGGPVDRLELNTAVARLGALKLTSTTVAGKPVAATVDDQTIVMPLGGVLPAGGTVTARVAYRATLRTNLAGSNWMFTRANGIVDAYRWLPWVSRPVAFSRPNYGDPYVTPVSPRVRVAVTTDRPLVIATSGDRVAASGLTQTFVAENVRDFALTASSDYRTASAVVGDTTIRVYYLDGGPASGLLAAARNALTKMEALVGPYPYKTYRVAQSAGGYAMEAPGLAWLPRNLDPSRISYLVTHETAHQWFYGLVGGDQANEPFTDEAASDFLTRYVLRSRRASTCATAPLDRSIYRYSSACYYEIVYIQGGNLLDDLRKKMGPTAFWKGFRAWIAAERFAIAPTKSLLETLDAHTPLDLVPTLRARFPRLYS